MAYSPTPQPGPGGYGTASEFGSLDGWTLADAEGYLSQRSDLKNMTISAGNYRSYTFQDGPQIYIRPGGQVIRLPKPLYRVDGSRIKGYRINIVTGKVLSTQVWHNLPRAEHEWVVI